MTVMNVVGIVTAILYALAQVVFWDWKRSVAYPPRTVAVTVTSVCTEVCLWVLIGLAVSR